MISIYKLKPKFQSLLMPVLIFLHQKKISANQITLVSIFLSFVIGFLFWNSYKNHWLFLALPFGLLIRMALNALDGMMARLYNQQSKLGEVLNELGDVLSDVAIFFPLIKYNSQNISLIIVIIILSVINEMAGLLAKIVSGERRYDGPMGKSDRAFAISIYGIACFFSYQIINPYVLVITIILLTISTYLRVNNSIKK